MTRAKLNLRIIVLFLQHNLLNIPNHSAKGLKDKSGPDLNFKDSQIHKQLRCVYAYLQYTMGDGRSPKGVQGAKRNSGNGPLGKGVERDNQHEAAIS